MFTEVYFTRCYRFNRMKLPSAWIHSCCTVTIYSGTIGRTSIRGQGKPTTNPFPIERNLDTATEGRLVFQYVTWLSYRVGVNTPPPRRAQHLGRN